MRQEILTGLERRRRWSVEQKLSIVGEASGAPGRVAEVARRHDVSRQQVYQWRRELRRKGLWPGDPPPVLLPVTMVDGAGCPNDGAEGPGSEGAVDGGGGDHRPASGEGPECAVSSDLVEIVVRTGRVVRVRPDVPDHVLGRLIRIAEAS